LKSIQKRLTEIKARLNFLSDNYEKVRTDQYIDHQFVISKGLIEEEISSVEQRSNISLPIEYREFLKVVGDNNVGPGGFMDLSRSITVFSKNTFPIDKPLLGTLSVEHSKLPEDKQWNNFGELVKIFNNVRLQDGVINICEYGCGIGGKLILNGKFTGQIWIQQGDVASYAPFGNSELLHEVEVAEWNPSNDLKEYMFLDWYEHWLYNFEIA
jgi:SMI1 / KNR4 family (SUKH-1)